MDETDESLDIEEWFGDDDKIALRVEGDFMIGDHIADGDFVVIDRRKQAENGQIVAFRDEAARCVSLRYYHRMKNGQIRFESSDGRAREIVDGDSVTILGVLVGVVRKY